MMSVLRTSLNQFIQTSRLRNTGRLLRGYSEKKAPPKDQHKKAAQNFENKCDVCELYKPCGRCPEADLQPGSEKNLPGCMPFSESVPMPRPQPQFTEECISVDCPVDCNRSKRKGPPRCPRRVPKVPEHEECKTTGRCEDRDSAKKTKDCE